MKLWRGYLHVDEGRVMTALHSDGEDWTAGWKENSFIRAIAIDTLPSPSLHHVNMEWTIPQMLKV